MVQRNFEYFKDGQGSASQQVSETIAKIRHQHYEEKRRAKLELLERTLRNGLLGNLVKYSNLSQKNLQPGGPKQSVASPVALPMAAINQSPLPRKTLKDIMIQSGNSPSKLLATGGSPTALAKSIGKTQGTSLSLTQVPVGVITAAGPDIPMRDPLDIEFKLNHKLAKQLYEQEMQQKVKENLEKKQREREDKIAKLEKEEAKKLKAMEEAQKTAQEQLEAQKLKKSEKLRAVIVNREHSLKVREQELKKQEKEVKERLRKIQEEKDEAKRKAQEDAFHRDIQHMREKTDKGGESFLQAKVRLILRVTSL